MCFNAANSATLTVKEDRGYTVNDHNVGVRCRAVCQIHYPIIKTFQHKL